MKVRVRRVATGPGPSEVVVAILSSDGEEELVVDVRSLDDDTLPVGGVFEQNGSVLVEFPRETLSGKWRAWVPIDQVVAPEGVGAPA